MDRRLAQKITAAALLFAPMFTACEASAGDKFVKYAEVQDSLKPKPGPNAGWMTADQLRDIKNRNELVYILDARTKNEFDREHIEGAKLPKTDDYYRDQEMFMQKIAKTAPSSKMALEKGMKDIPKDAPIVTYCNKHCGLSKSLKLDLEVQGYANVKWLEGGIDDWRDKGYPLTKTS